MSSFYSAIWFNCKSQSLRTGESPTYQKNLKISDTEIFFSSPGRCGSVPAWEPKGRQFDSHPTAHAWALVLWGGGTWQATIHWRFSPSFSLSPSLKINKVFNKQNSQKPNDLGVIFKILSVFKVIVWKVTPTVLGTMHNVEVKVSEVTDFCPWILYRGIHKVLSGKQLSRWPPSQEKATPLTRTPKIKSRKGARHILCRRFTFGHTL